MANELVSDFVRTMDRIGGVHQNGLPGNAYELDTGDPPAREVGYPEGTWQAELLWQFLLHADRAGVDLRRFEVQANVERLTLDRAFARGLDVYNQRLFNGIFILPENNNEDVRRAGRKLAAPINHTAETISALAQNLRQTGTSGGSNAPPAT
jgi:hypothetical protein